MLNIKKSIGLIIALCTATVGTVASAANNFITIKGSAEDTKAVTVLLLEKGADFTKINPADILYVNQAEVVGDGFSIRLPMLDKMTYDMYSNVLTEDDLSRDKIIYLSENGDDKNSGESADSPLKTFDAVYKKLHQIKEIVLLSDYTLIDFPTEYEGNLTIRGDVATRRIAIPTDSQVVNLKGDLTMENCVIAGGGTIYANGHKLVIKDTVSSENKLNLYGGSASADVQGDTNLEIYGGRYSRIYGGGNGKAVNGNTYVTVAGNVNPNETIADNNDDCYVLGGGNNGEVSGTTNVTYGGYAKFDYIAGAGGSGKGTAAKTEINIIGGQVMNVYAGGLGATVTGDTHILMTGGTAEALFGGSNNANLIGNTCVDVFGGTVTRRVYTGCYNNMTYFIGASWDSDYYVKGTTTLRLKPGASVVTGNDMNRGLFCGSRTKSKHEDEKNFVIYLGGCQSTYENFMGEKGGTAASHLKNYLDYTVSASKGGDVFAVGNDSIYVKPDEGYYGVIGGNKYANQTVRLQGANTTVDFVKDASISSVSGTVTETGVSADVEYSVGDKPSDIYVALYAEGRMLTCTKADADLENGEITADLTSELVAGNEYEVLVMMWDKYGEPVTSKYSIIVKN